MKTPFVVIVLACAILIWVRASAQQEMHPRPGPGSGVVKVTGTVDIGKVPTIAATQHGDWRVAQYGEWRVAVTEAPPVVVAGPEFARKGGRYSITWPAGDQETVTLVGVGSGGWAQVEHSGGGAKRRWVNFASARAVEEAP